MLIVLFLVSIVLVLLAGARPVFVDFSEFELSRRQKAGQLTLLDAKRAIYFGAVKALLDIKAAILMIIFALLAINTLGWVNGSILSFVLVIVYRLIANLGPIRRLSSRMYSFYERYMLAFCDKFPWLAKLESIESEGGRARVYSKEELLEVLKRSSGVLTRSELNLLKSSLQFGGKLVNDIMTPRSMIDSISHDELLGPITLTELHETGHSRFPVIEGDIDHVVGMLYVRDLLAVDGNKNSFQVSQVMDKTVCFIRQDQTLDQALAAFLKTKKLLFVVVNEFRETVGLLSLEDVIEALLGQKINDEFEKYSDIRAVAKHNPRKNNTPENSHV